MSRSASEIRYYEERPCEHGEVERHPTPVVLVDRLGPGKDDTGYDWGNMCPGGSRREITVDYRAAAIEWLGDKPPDAYPGDWEQMITSVIEQTVKPVVDAAMGCTGEDET